VRESTVEKWGDRGPQDAPLQNFFLDRYAEAYRAEMDHFAGVISGAHRPSVGYRDGVAALAIAEAAQQSLLSSTKVAVTV
jgi:myo-inositol 2-dehydrogenase/D-chiro-inositol 1-dehydrogenase